MLARTDIDGASDRLGVFAALQSFDHEGMHEAAFTDAALDLLRIPGADSAELVLRHYVERFSDHAIGQQGLVDPTPAQNAQAEEILRNRFTFYGEAHELGPDIDWDLNPGTAHWGHDLNRFGYLRTLWSAYEVSGDARFSEKIPALILDWIAKTDVCDAFTRLDPQSRGPDKSPYVWGSYLNTAIHTEGWARILTRLLPSCPGLISPQDFLRMVKSVHDQLHYLQIVIPEAIGNWVTIGTRGQISVLSVFRELRAAPELARTAWERLETASAGQVLPDGSQSPGQYEQHRCHVCQDHHSSPLTSWSMRRRRSL